MKKIFFFLLVLGSGQQSLQAQKKFSAYLFTYFTGNAKEDEQIRFALSYEGYQYKALNHNQPVLLSSNISSSGGVRDPHILRGANGKTFYMVATDMVSAKGWDSNRAMVLLKSTDLIHWTSSVVNIQKRFPGNDSLLRVWAPQTIYDTRAKKYMIYWSMKHGKDADKIYYAYANDAFTDLETTPEQLFYSPTNGSCIDGDIVFKDGLYHLFFKTEGAGAGIKIAVSDRLTGGYTLKDQYVQQTKDPVEGAGVFKLHDRDAYILMYDVYTKGQYQFTETKDLQHFSIIDQQVKMNFHPRHGTIISITKEEAMRLEKKWGEPYPTFQKVENAAIKKINIFIDTLKKQVHLPVKPKTDLTHFDPQFKSTLGISLKPTGPQNFSKGSVTYQYKEKGQAAEKWQVFATTNHNPVLEGYYADPDILYAAKTGKYYIYPTSDGFTNWTGTYFKTFSSEDLVQWKDEGVILDLEKDVSWAKRNAWAPCIIEKKVNGQFKYFFYFTAAQKIGVAVADNPQGPFKDIGHALIDHFPPGINRGQQIDPEVFQDPVSGKSYLYWGNSYMAVAELNEDMVSINETTLKVITPDASFREGTTVFYRNGLYYFLWSEDDTRSEKYKVRYGTSTSPMGPISTPSQNIVIQKNRELEIYATGHNSILQLPGKDIWYVVYHRFTYPKGVTMGRSAGYNREVCIDEMRFDATGNIIEVIPTHKGVTPIK